MITDTAHLTAEQEQQLQHLWTAWDAEPPAPSVWNAGLSLVALHDGQVVGFIAATHGGQPFAYIDMAIVREDMRGRGIGVLLLLEIERRLYDLGVRCTRIVSRSGSQAASIVSRLGWEPLEMEIVLEKHYV